MLAGNVGIVRGCVKKLMAEGFDGIIIMATNPVDVLTYIVQKESGLAPVRVIGSGTLLDSERLRHILGEQLDVDPRSVHAAVIGEHGDSSVAGRERRHPPAFLSHAIPERMLFRLTKSC